MDERRDRRESGTHGISGSPTWRDSYALHLPNFGHVRAPRWDALGACGKTTIVLNVPGTYPAKDIKGVMVSGFVAVSLERAVRPAARARRPARPWLPDRRRHVNADQRPAAFFADLFATLGARRRVLRHYLASSDWDCFLGVVTETDRLHHYFWSAYVDPHHPWHQRFLDFYAEVDAALGELVDVLDDDTALFIVADHGHTAIESECYPNAWLRAEGLLALRADATAGRASMADLDRASRVFILDPGRVYVNLVGRFAEGVVRPGAEAEDLLARVAAGMLALEYPGPRSRASDAPCAPCTVATSSTRVPVSTTRRTPCCTFTMGSTSKERSGRRSSSVGAPSPVCTRTTTRSST